MATSSGLIWGTGDFVSVSPSKAIVPRRYTRSLGKGETLGDGSVRHDTKGKLIQVSSQLDGVEELQNIRMVARSSGGESASKWRVRVKRARSVPRGNGRERKKVRVMSEGRDFVEQEKQGTLSMKTIIQGAGEVAAVEVDQGIILRRSQGDRCEDFESGDNWDKGGEGSTGTVLSFRPVKSSPSITLKGPRKVVPVVTNLARGARSQTEPGRRSSRVEKNGREGLRLDRVLSTRNDASLGLRIFHTEGKGRGILTTRRFVKGEPVVEYKGTLLSYGEARAKQESGEDATYMFYSALEFGKSRPQRFCVDASWESGRFGRLVNHSKKRPNCEVRVEMVNDEPHLILVAAEDIGVGVEITYNYGIKDKEYVKANSWLLSS